MVVRSALSRILLWRWWRRRRVRVVHQPKKRTNMAYEFPNKTMQRLMVHGMYRECPEGKPVVFLDDENAGACTYFLNDGIPAQHLKPVNHCGTHATAITKTSGIPCTCDDIGAHLTSLPDDSHSVVWLDYTCTTVDIAVLRQALRVAPRVMVNTSLRGVARDAHFKHIRNLVGKVGTLRLGPYSYKGKAGIENMMSFIVNRYPDGGARARKRDAGSEGLDRAGRTTDDEVQATPTFRANDSVAVAWRGHKSLTAVVMDTSDDQVQVVFDCDGAVKWMPLSKVTHHRTECSRTKLDAFVGKTILVPKKLWSGKKMTGYGDVKVVGKKLAFMVVKRYYNGNRYTIAGISKRDNRPLRKREAWTITYEQACCFTNV